MSDNTVKRWVIVSWGDCYGKCLGILKGSHEDAYAEAQNYVSSYKLIGICELIEAFPAIDPKQETP